MQAASGVDFALSPNGRLLVYSESGKLWIRPLDALEAESVPATVGAQSPFWSPDSRYVGFFEQGKLKRLDVARRIRCHGVRCGARFRGDVERPGNHRIRRQWRGALVPSCRERWRASRGNPARCEAPRGRAYVSSFFAGWASFPLRRYAEHGSKHWDFRRLSGFRGDETLRHRCG